METPDDHTLVVNFKSPVTKRLAEYSFARSGDLLSLILLDLDDVEPVVGRVRHPTQVV